MLAGGFGSWLSAVACARRHRGLILRSLARLSRRALAEAILGWRDECDALAAARVAAEASLTRLCNGALQMAFHAWVRAASFDSAEAIAALKDGQLSLEAELDMLRADKERFGGLPGRCPPPNLRMSSLLRRVKRHRLLPSAPWGRELRTSRAN